MKYIVFFFAALGVPPLAFLLFINKRWQKYAFWAVIGGLMLYNSTSINFLSMEEYRGSARGMEVSIVHLFAMALLLSLKMQGKAKRLVPELGFFLYIVYFCLCLFSLTSAANLTISWFEVWKMMLLYLFYLSVFHYLAATDDIDSIVKGLVVYALVNFIVVVKDRFAGVFQTHGLFPHQNSMAMVMTLLGTLFFAGYLSRGVKSRLGRWCLLGWICAAISTLRSLSRGALVLMPAAYGIVALCCFLTCQRKRVITRLLPFVFLGMIVIAMLLPKIIERFVNAPESSGETRREFVWCAIEMIKDEPLRGVGLNNWSLKLQYPYFYQEIAGELHDRELHHEGIVETVYLLVMAECGIPAFLAMMAWFLWHWYSSLRLVRRLRGTEWSFVPCGLLGGLTAVYLQSCLEWVLRQQISLFVLAFLFAIISYLNKTWRISRRKALQ